MRQVISKESYITDMETLSIDWDFDCIVALKRSGFIMGVFLSNKLNKPLFVPSEVDSIPDRFKNILVVDDKICKGKSIQKVINTLKDKNIKTAALYIERDVLTDYYVVNLGKIVKMWYEV